MKIGLDLDGVGFVFHENFYEYASRYFDIEFSVPQRWEFYLDWGISQSDFISLCNKGVDDGYIFNGKILPEYNELINTLRKEHSIHIITDRFFGSRPTNSWLNTINCLNSNNVYYDTLSFSKDKTVLETDYFLEDKIDNYDKLVVAGCNAYLLNQKWNIQADNRKRVNSLQEFAEIVMDGIL